MESSIYFEENPKAALSLRKYIPAQFRASAAKAIYDRFEAEAVYDPCGGWGDRMAAAIAAKSVTCYHCRDVNPNVFPGYAEQIRRYDIFAKVSVEMVPAENKGLEGAGFDLVFTSPPYYKIEKYAGEHQSHRLYKGFDEWINGFLFPMANRSWESLRDGGRMLINVADCYADHQINFICQPFVDWCVDNLPDCEYAGAIGYEIAQRVGRRMSDSSTPAEPILIFSKGPSVQT